MKSRNRVSSALLLSMLILTVAGACRQSGTSDVSQDESQRIVLATIDETKAFVQNDLAQPIPDSYDIPSYITSGLPIEQVYDTLEKRYPQFYGLEGETYLRAIMNAPEQYQQLSLENKAIRRYYDPNSRY
ncbi:MAG: hypothetical protein R3330_06900 [Saprospiraceae bacterium]|nr:hypothetical protein [Saprospiraceae bacterium]